MSFWTSPRETVQSVVVIEKRHWGRYLFTKRGFRSSRQYLRLAALALLSAAASGCAAIEEVRHDPNLSPENAAHVMMYRPTEDRMGSVIDFRAYAGEAFLGSLERGGAIDAFVRPGRTTIRVQPHFLGIPDGWPAKLELDLRVGERYHLRFSQFIDSVMPLPGGVVISGGTRLRMVTESAYNNRE